MALINFIVALIMAVSFKLTTASPTPGTLGDATGNFLSAYLPGSTYGSIDFAGALPGEGHINGQITNKCPYPVYVRQAVAQTSGVTGEKCEYYGETADFKLEPGKTWVSPRRTHWDGCGTSPSRPEQIVQPLAALLKIFSIGNALACASGAFLIVKISHDIGDLKVYQVEYSVDRRNKKVWYNLSAEDGTPFQEAERYLAVGSIDCMAVHCLPGQYGKDPTHGCDWPLQPVCANIGQVVAVVCGRW